MSTFSVVASGLCSVVLLAGCSSASTPVGTSTSAPAANPTPAAAGPITLNGAGSSFDAPLFSTAFTQYTKLTPNVQVNYQSVGSGAGIQQLTEGTVDFGASDAPLTDEQLAAAENDVVHVPVTLGAVSV